MLPEFLSFVNRYAGLLGIGLGLFYIVFGWPLNRTELSTGLVVIVLGLSHHWGQYGPSVKRKDLGRLSLGWKLYLIVYRGVGLTGISLGLLVNGGLWNFNEPVAVGYTLGLGGWSAWFWFKQFPAMRPIFGDPSDPREVIGGADPEKMRQQLADEQVLQRVAPVLEGISHAAEALDVVSNSPESSAASAPSGRTFHTADNRRVLISGDGRVYLSGKFIGSRSADGRVTDGGGSFVGTIKKDGALHGPNGDYLGKIFS